MIDYRSSAYPFISNPSARGSSLARKAAITAGIYGGAAGVGYLIAGPAGSLAGIVAVPEVVVVPIIVMS